VADAAETYQIIITAPDLAAAGRQAQAELARQAAMVARLVLLAALAAAGQIMARKVHKDRVIQIQHRAVMVVMAAAAQGAAQAAQV
jgi:hypothetical protein